MKHTNIAPIPRTDLEPCLKPFGHSRMLPRIAYTDEDVLKWEKRNFFENNWVCAGRSSLVAEAGSQTAVRVNGRGVLLTRDATGALRAFENVCTHRGHELLACGEKVKRNGIVCPYHAWSYGLDGSLRNARGTKDIANACKEDLGLKPLKAAEWGGWIFVNSAPDAASLTQQLGNLPDMLTNWECERLLPGPTHHYELNANWKIATENYLECYHCPSIHPALCRVSPPQSGDAHREVTGSYIAGWMDLIEEAETMSFSGQTSGIMFRKLDQTQLRQVLYIVLFPGMLISLHPDYVMTHRIEPLTATTTYIECQWLFAPESFDRPDFDPSYAVNFWDTTNKEDWHAVESVQRGLQSERFVPGILASEEEQLHEFVYLVASGYLGKPSLPHAQGTKAA
ncbi:MAG: aromatic ring-hydroxylating oxygenase subunit alpha [Hyphomicrobium sp.]